MSHDGPVKGKTQSRLPFKVLDVKKTLPNSSQLKKRKLSDNETIHVANKLSKKEDNVDTANISAKADTENVPSNDHVAKSEDSIKLEIENVFQNKISNFISVDDKSGKQKSNLEQNYDQQINVANISGSLSTSPSSSNPALESNAIIRVNSKKDSIAFISNNESEMEFSRTETSELDASLIFNQGSQLGDSECANPSSSKKKRSSPMNPKKIEEKEKRKQEKLRLRAEREKQLQEARELKKKEKEEEKQHRDQKKLEEKQRKQRELEEKKLKEQKEREEKLRILQEKKEKMEQERLEKLKAKEEEKLKKLKLLNEKQDEKKKKEEERLKKLEDKRKSEEEEEKKKLKEKASFAKFFIKNETSPSTTVEEKNGIFKPFEVKKDMTVASVVPSIASSLFRKDDFETSFEEQESSELYLNQLRLGKHTPLYKMKEDLRNEAQIKCDDDEDEVVLLYDDSSSKTKHKAKLLQFHENVRPPYYGTWMKQSTIITARKPFAEDTAFFDYELDSDEDWEEGGPGESLSGTDDEKESEDDYEVDNEFFVPHGYLSADEEKDDERGENPENLQKRLKMRQLEFQEQLKKKCMEMKPRITGCLWLAESNTDEGGLKEKLSLFAAVTLVPMPIFPSQNISNTTESEGVDSTVTPAVEPKTTMKVPDEALPYFIQLLHANTNNRNIICKEFQQFWLKKSRELNGKLTIEEQPEADYSKPNISKRQLDITMQKIASWMRCPDPAMNRLCWWVCDEVREKHSCKDLPIPNQWNYITRKDPEPSPNKVKSSNVAMEIEKPTPIEPQMPCILKFAKVIVSKHPSNSGTSEKVKNENEKTLTSVETKFVSDKSKKARRIVPTTIVGKNKWKAPVSSVENASVKELDKKGLVENIKVTPLNKPGCSDKSSNNVDISQEKVSECLKLDEQLKVNKTATDGTPSILKFVKRIAPVKVDVSSKIPKLMVKKDLNESCIVLD